MASKSFFNFVRLILHDSSQENPSSFKHLKYYRQWKTSLQPGRNAIADELPWITFPAIDFLKQHLNKESKVFEYGAGGSTLFFINRVKEVITIEHHPEWYNKLQDKIQEKHALNWTGKLIPPEDKDVNMQLDPSNPNHYYTNEEPYSDCIFRLYVTYIDNYPDNYFDLIMIDGRSRSSCIWHSMPKVKAGGFLVVDNSNRKNYFTGVQQKLESDFQLIADQKAPSPYLEYLTQTAIWQKK